MAVTRADKEAELQQLETAFKGSDSAILVDYKGLNVPQVTELRRQLRAAKASYKVVKNTLAKRALKGTSFEPLEKHFEGTTAVAYTDDRSGRARQDADDVRQDGADADDQGGGRAGPRDQAGRGRPSWRRCRASRSCTRKLLVRAAGADGADRQRAERRAARSDERAGAGGEEDDRKS